MVSYNWITLALHEWRCSIPDTTLVSLSRYLHRNNMEIRKIHNDSNRYTMLARNHSLMARIVLENRDGEWIFRVTRITPI